MAYRIEHLNGFAKKQLTLTRLYHAPVELVFATWTNAGHLRQWWGPHGFTNPVCELEVRPGGRIYIDMTAPDGVVFPMGGCFHEISKPRKLVFTSSAFEDEEGNCQLENLNTITFSEEEGTTQLTVQAVVMKATPEADAALDGMEEGWSQSLDKLEAYLQKQVAGTY